MQFVLPQERRSTSQRPNCSQPLAYTWLFTSSTITKVQTKRGERLRPMRGFRARGAAAATGEIGDEMVPWRRYRLTTSPRLFFSAHVMRAQRMATGCTPPPPSPPASASVSSSSVSSAGGRRAGPGPAMARTKSAAASAARSCPRPLTSIALADAGDDPPTIWNVPERTGRRRRATRRRRAVASGGGGQRGFNLCSLWGASCEVRSSSCGGGLFVAASARDGWMVEGDGWVAELGHFWCGPWLYVLARWAGCEAVVGQGWVLRLVARWARIGFRLVARWAFDID
jgi:hypothetical protein